MTTFEFSLTNCPRCNGLWDISGDEWTCQCGMVVGHVSKPKILSTVVDELVIWWVYFTLSDYTIYWNNEGGCHVRHQQGKLTPLNWIDLNTTREQLALYLTFS